MASYFKLNVTIGHGCKPIDMIVCKRGVTSTYQFTDSTIREIVNTRYPEKKGLPVKLLKQKSITYDEFTKSTEKITIDRDPKTATQSTSS